MESLSNRKREPAAAVARTTKVPPAILYPPEYANASVGTPTLQPHLRHIYRVTK